jgi:hypothetical protein
MPLSDAIIETRTCKVVLAFPWTNGVVLAESRRAWVDKALVEKRHPEGVVDIIQVSNPSP